MADPRRNRPPNRPPRPAAPLTGEITVDDETAAALAMFNARLAQQAEAERAQRRVDKATREKDQAAARVRALESDTKATADERAEAAAAYKASLEALERIKKGEPDPPRAPAPAAETETDAAAEPETDAAADADAAPEPEPEPAAEAPSAPDDGVDAVEPADAALDETPPADR